jgi:hypothetical protein
VTAARVLSVAWVDSAHAVWSFDGPVTAHLGQAINQFRIGDEPGGVVSGQPAGNQIAVTYNTYDDINLAGITGQPASVDTPVTGATATITPLTPYTVLAATATGINTVDWQFSAAVTVNLGGNFDALTVNGTTGGSASQPYPDTVRLIYGSANSGDPWYVNAQPAGILEPIANPQSGTLA